MRYGTTALLIGTTLISACSNSDSSDDPLTGQWVSESCDQLSNASGEAVMLWGKANYHFTLDGTLQGTHYVHGNADCSGDVRQSDSGLGNPDMPTMDFAVLGSETADNGLPAWRVDWTLRVAGEEPLQSDGLVQLVGERLCFPSWLTLGASGFGFGAGSSADIDYSYGRCLTRV